MKTYNGTLFEVDGKIFSCHLRSDEYIERARELIEGWIEQLPCVVNGKDVVALIDEDGRHKKLPLNQSASKIVGKLLVGPVIILDQVPNED